jgi:type VI secretion system secreted protein Hcp
MKYGTFKGNVTEAGHKDWIELGSFQWGVGRGISSPTGSSTTREGSNPSISEIVVTKHQDGSSTYLFTDAVAGKMNTDVTIEFTATAAGKVATYLKYQLTDTGLSGYSVSSGGDRPSESLSLNFTKIIWTFTPTAADLTGTPNTVGYNLSTMTTT